MPEVLERKLQQIREGSYVLTLPKDWVEREGLRKGSSVMMCVERGLLRVYPLNRSGVTSIIDQDLLSPREVEESLRLLYALGVDRAVVRSSGSLSGEVREVLRRSRVFLPGALVTFEENKSVVVEFAGDVLKGHLQALRTFSSSFSACLSRLVEGGSKEEVEEVMAYSYAQRRAISREQLRPTGSINVLEVSLLSFYTDSCIRMTEHLLELPAIDPRSEVRELLTAVGRSVREAVRYYESGDVSRLNALVDDLHNRLHGIESIQGEADVHLIGIIMSCISALESLREAVLVRYLGEG
ncbi:MAG: hypothetical protein NZ920_01790 [Aigarchaeota archaeon]|nr:hypothetical protein [Aigarchaeota archaeon]MDW8093175.1 hypothetical protein [Nitrososphaerota archaeon]